MASQFNLQLLDTHLDTELVTMLQAVGRLTNRSLSIAMEEWRYQTWKGAALKRAARFMQNQALAAAMNSWKQHHDMCLMERAVAKFTQASSCRWAICAIFWLQAYGI